MKQTHNFTKPLKKSRFYHQLLLLCSHLCVCVSCSEKASVNSGQCDDTKYSVSTDAATHLHTKEFCVMPSIPAVQTLTCAERGVKKHSPRMQPYTYLKPRARCRRTEPITSSPLASGGERGLSADHWETRGHYITGSSPEASHKKRGAVAVWQAGNGPCVS